jgi:hypothetical protein
MTRTSLTAAVAALALALAACGSSPAATTTTQAAGGGTTTTAPSSGTTAAPSTTAGATTGAGSATLTIGDMTFTFNNYYCAVGEAETRNSRVSFSSGAFGETDGHRTQLDASIQDTSEQGAMEGDSTIQSISLNDVEDFENPVVAYESVSGFIGEPGFTIMYDGSHVTAEANFDDSTTDEIESIPGTLEATCGG